MGLDTANTKPPQILLVEDEANIALALSFLMQREGYEVTHIDNGRAALDALDEDAPDLVLLDVTLPEVSGYEICQRIKAQTAGTETKVLILTARGTEVEKRKALALGADAFMSKPFDTGALTAAVAELLGRA